MKDTIAVGIGGVVGAVMRYGLSLAFNSIGPAAFPWGTLLCNLVGCFALGCVSALSEHRLPARLRLALSTGVIGAFTTFSTFSLELVQLLQQGRIGSAFTYGVTSSLGGALLIRSGMVLGGWRPLTPRREGQS